jgi:Mn2+/Fe2+ NRAMP family transporter
MDASKNLVRPDRAPKQHQGKRPTFFRALGLGLITGAADDDPSAIGTYAAAGATIGPSFLWTSLVTFPMMFAVVYLSAKLGQVAGKSLFRGHSRQLAKWILYRALTGVLFGNVIEAGADIGSMAAAINLLVPIPFGWIVIGVAVVILSLQIWGSYVLIRNVFRWLALSLLAYIASAILAQPDVLATITGTLIPSTHFDKIF